MEGIQQGREPDTSYQQWLDYPYVQRLTEFGVTNGDVDWFLVLLRVNDASDPFRDYNWREAAKFDHHPKMDWGHDITEERLHLDVHQNGEKVFVERGFPEVPLNHAIRFCEAFFDKHYETYVGRY